MTNEEQERNLVVMKTLFGKLFGKDEPNPPMENRQSAFETKDNNGVINMKLLTKQGSRGPYQVRVGNQRVGGKDYWINAYMKTTAGGEELLCLKIEEKPTQGIAH